MTPITQEKAKNGTNRISASRLQQISEILKVQVPFFFEGAPNDSAEGSAPMPDYVTSFLATPEGLALARAFMQIKKRRLRRCITDIVTDLAKHG